MYAWVYNCTRGSLIPMIVMHTVTNVMSIFIPQTLPVYALAVVVATGFVVGSRPDRLGLET